MEKRRVYEEKYYGSAIWFLPLMTFLLAAGSAAASGHTIVHKNEKPEPTSVHDFQNDVSNRRHWDGGRFVREWYERPWCVPDSDGPFFLLADDDASQDRPPEGLLDRKEAEALLKKACRQVLIPT